MKQVTWRSDAQHLRPEREKYVRGIAGLLARVARSLDDAIPMIAAIVGLSIDHFTRVVQGTRSLHADKIAELREHLRRKLGDTLLEFNDPDVLGCPNKRADAETDGNACAVPTPSLPRKKPRRRGSVRKGPIDAAKEAQPKPQVVRLTRKGRRYIAVLLPADAHVEVSEPTRTGQYVITAKPQVEKK